MAKADKKMKRNPSAKSQALPFTKENYTLFAGGLGVILLGYLSLAKGPWDSFFSLSLAPVLLVIGYCVIIPLSILYRRKDKAGD